MFLYHPWEQTCEHETPWLGIKCIYFTFAFGQKLFRHEAILPIPQDEGQEREDESVKDSHYGQDVGPAHWAGSKAVLVRLLPTHPPHLVTVPAIRVNHTAQHQTETWGEGMSQRWPVRLERTVGELKKQRDHRGADDERRAQARVKRENHSNRRGWGWCPL